MTWQLETKAGTLAKLYGQMLHAGVLPLWVTSVGDWRRDQPSQLSDFDRKSWSADLHVVRSSAQAEDQATSSMAGKYLSRLGVQRPNLAEAIEAVIASYGDAADDDQVLVQPQLKGVELSGVLFNRDPNSGAPYVVISWSDAGDTDRVTSGADGSRTLVCSRDSSPPPLFSELYAILDELESKFGDIPLDIEFAKANDKWFLLQVRPLVVARPGFSRSIHRQVLDQIAAKIASHMHPHPHLRGRRTVFGIMPDWNPAEIIGVRPRPLALSLYRELITDTIWAYQRNNYGYRNLRSFPLLHSFHGLPYIDVRVSFNSFVPANLDDELADRLVDHYIDRLIQHPSLHDKVEFEIVFSCYDFTLPQRLSRLAEAGFNADERDTVANALRTLTNRIIHPNGLWHQDWAKVEHLEDRRRATLESNLDPIGRIYWLIEDCKRYGTLPFAGLARAGFIAVQLLNSLTASNVLSEADRSAFLNGIETVSSNLITDFSHLPKAQFLQRYGHLRPGTYDLLSARYDEAPDSYFDWSSAGAAKKEPHRERFALDIKQLRAIDALLRHHGLEHDVLGLFSFIEAGIKGREYAKYVFTQALSDALSWIGHLGDQHDLTLDDMSYLPISTLIRLHTESADVGSYLREAVRKGRSEFSWTEQLRLPPLIVSADQVHSFEISPTEPNVITLKRVTAPCVELPSNDSLDGSIVLITSADPGFDWIFSRNVKGFVTAYGGANSHMAIRAGELGIPAAIGVGELSFNKYAKAKILEVDAENRLIRILR